MSIASRFVGLMAIAGFACVGVAQAGPLPLDGNAIAGYHGTSAPFFSSQFGTSISASVEYAVYAPGQFNTSFGAGADPSAGTQFVYAYQLFNTGDSATSLALTAITVGLNTGNQGANIGSLPIVNGNYGQLPNSASFSGSPATSARWFYNPTSLPLGAASQVLLFTSPHGPTFKTSSVQGGGLGASQPLPTPVPEPGTIALAILGCAGLLAARFAKNRRA